MKPSIDALLVAASDALEKLILRLERLGLEDKVDVGARIRAIIKNAEDLDEKIKKDLKELNLDMVLGNEFKAAISRTHPVKLNQKNLREKEPAIYKKYSEPTNLTTVTYQAR